MTIRQIFLALTLFVSATGPVVNCHAQITTFESYLNSTWNFYTQTEGFTGLLENPNHDGFLILQNRGAYNEYILKMDLSGHIQNCFAINDSTKTNGLTKMIRTPDNNILIAGVTISTHFTILMKLDNSGNVIWTNKYKIGTAGVGAIIENVIVTPDSSIILVGGAYNNKSFLWKFDKNGNSQWVKLYHRTSTSEEFNEIILDKFGNFYVLATSNGFYSKYLLKLDGSGNIIWAKKNLPSMIRNILLDTANNELWVTSSSSIVKIDSSGTILWDKTYDSKIADDNVHYIFPNGTGVSILTNNPSFQRFQMCSFDSVGTPINSKYFSWNTNMVDTSDLLQADIVTRTFDKGFLVLGSFRKTVYYAGPPPWSWTLAFKPYVMKIDSSFNAACHSFPFNLQITASNTYQADTAIYIMSSSTTTTYPFTFTVSSITIADSLECIIAGVDEPIALYNQLSIFPNPFSKQTTLQTGTTLKNASLTVYNSVGQTVKRIDNLSGQTVMFNRDNLPSGLYFVRLTQDGNTISADKFVITDK